MFFFFNDPATTEIYTLSLHDALPISLLRRKLHEHLSVRGYGQIGRRRRSIWPYPRTDRCSRSEEHTSELQSLRHLVCRLLLEKKKSCTEKLPRSHFSDRPSALLTVHT